jgi:GNAT superfamily N-acetyltransferase
MDELSTALACERGVRTRAAQQTTPLSAGVAVRHDDLPAVYHLNAVLLDAPLPQELDPPALVALADRCLHGLGHRRVVIDDAGAAERISPTLLHAGWTRQRTVFMIWRASAEAVLRDDVRARQISDAELYELQLEVFTDDRGADLGAPVIAALADAQAALRTGTPARGFGAAEDGRLAAMATLFLDQSPVLGRAVAMIDEVGTLSAYRRRGLGRAVVTAALQTARRLGYATIVIPADADDWPQLMYAKLGFEPVGVQVSFTLARSVGSLGP